MHVKTSSFSHNFSCLVLPGAGGFFWTRFHNLEFFLNLISLDNYKILMNVFDARDVQFLCYRGSVRGATCLLMDRFISRYCAMEMIEVDVFYPEVHGSREFITLNFNFLCV